MKWSVATLGLAAIVTANDLKPDASTPDGCSTNYNGQFEVSIFKAGNSKRHLQRRDCSGDKSLVLTLKDSVLKDNKDRTGEIVANYQFQFDGPPQAGAIYTSGFSTCQNGSLALGDSTIFYQCRSGDFYNLYDRSWAQQCEPVELVAMPCGNEKKGVSPMQSPVGTDMVVTTIVSAISDGQPQVTTTTVPVPMCQIGDGQVQAHSTPCDQAPGAPLSQISDGQIQAPTNVPTQIPDGQVQVPVSTGAPVSQISDGQVQASSGAPVSQISDGQVQAPSGTLVTQISDGQVQAPTATGAPVSQISDGQVQAPSATATVPFNDGVKTVPALLAAGMGVVLFL